MTSNFGDSLVPANPSGTQPTFVQQGQVDWVAFGRTSWNASTAVLQRFATAGVQPATYGAGLALSSQFNLDPRGQRRMEEALARLRGVPAFESLLWLGFGYQSLVNVLAKTVGGIKCIALCSCLADANTEVTAAWVLTGLWRHSNYPEQYQPSHRQFITLVRACSGVVGTSFSQTIDVMLGDMLWKLSPEGHGHILEASNPDDVAKALRGLFSITRGEVTYISVVGGIGCAFVAALAYWLFGLKVHVENDSQEVIFTSVPDHQTAQVYVQYATSGSSIQMKDTTYILGSYRDIVERITDIPERILVVRTPWDGCLQRTFGTAYEKISKMPLQTGTYLGSVARIYRALALSEENVGALDRRAFAHYVETSYGQGFISTVFETFPELNRVNKLRYSAQVAAEASFDDAMKAVEQSVLAVENFCGCVGCAPESEPIILSKVCLVGVLYAIREVSRTMASVIMDSDVLPSVEGLKAFSQYGKPIEFEPSEETDEDYNARNMSQWDKSELA